MHNEERDMAIHKLTWGFVQKVTEAGVYGDGAGLWLQVRNEGAAKSWLFRWTDRRTKQDRNMGLGPVHTVDIAQARQNAKHCRELVAAGKDPLKERKSERLDSEIRAGLARTVRDVVDEFYDAHIQHLGKNKKRKLSREDFLRQMRLYVLPTIGDIPIAKVTRPIILDKMGLRRMWMEHYPTARDIYSYLRRIFSMAIEAGYCGHPKPPNPLDWEGLKHVLPSPKRVHKVKHYASLPYLEAGRFMRHLRAHQDRSLRLDRKTDTGRPITALLLEFVALSAVRVSEAVEATWDQFQDLDGPNPIWVVPAENHKSGHITDEPHRVPLIKPMLAILDEMKRCRGVGGIVFSSIHCGHRQPFAHSAATTFVKRVLGWEDVDVTTHGFRTTFGDWARANGYPPAWIDLQQGHIPHGQTAQAYQKDDLVEPRRAMMEAWGKFCDLPPADETRVTNLHDHRRSA
jgi:integrase